MARLNLTTRSAFGVRYHHPNDRPGTTTVIPVYHLYISVCVAPRGSSPNWQPVLGEDDPGQHSRQFEAVLDTGAPLTVIPYRVWRRFAADVDILAQPSSDSRFEIGGGSHNGQFGRIRLGATDDTGRWMAAEWTMALFLDESTAATSLQVPLIGLNAHFFSHRRRLGHVGSYEDDNLATVPEWCLEDKPRLLSW